MGASLHVGYLDDLRRNDAEGFAALKKEFAALNKVLKAAKVPTYKEPETLPDLWSFKLYPSNGLAFLQRFACYCADDEIEEWPTPGDPDKIENPLLDDMVEEAYFMLELLPHQHLILHHPKAGYWVPVDFEDVIFAPEKTGFGQLGSAVRLKAECEDLAQRLQLPLTLDPDSAEVRAAMLKPGKSRTRWKKYGVESHNLLALYQACCKSIDWGAAICLN